MSPSPTGDAATRQDWLQQMKNTMDRLRQERNDAKREVRTLQEKLDDMEDEVQRLTRLSTQRFYGRNQLRGSAATALSMHEKSNIDTVKVFFKAFFCHVKFPHDMMYKWAPSDKNTLSHRLFSKITWPRNEDKEYYFETVVAPVFNRVWTEKTANINTALKDQFMREDATRGPFHSTFSGRFLSTTHAILPSCSTQGTRQWIWTWKSLLLKSS